MSWAKWEQIQKEDAMVITIGFNQISDCDMEAEAEAEVGNVLQLALGQSNHVLLIIPNKPLSKYFTSLAEWYISADLGDLLEAKVTADALKLEQIYANRHEQLLNLFKVIHHCRQSLRIVEMQHELTPADICEDGCHLSPQGAAKTANAIAQSLKCQKRGVVGKRSAYASKFSLASALLMVAWFLRRRLLHRLPTTL